MGDTKDGSVSDVRDLTREEYELFRKLVYEKVGINLGERKLQLVRARLAKRLRQGRFRTFREYYSFVKGDQSGDELVHLIDAISTNTTHLFRENQHFDFLAEKLRDWVANHDAADNELRIWSAACSSGEEPHTLAMVVADALGKTSFNCRILATDISTRVLERARVGRYETERLTSVPESFQRRFFERDSDDQHMRIRSELLNCIKFARFNLMSEQFPFRRGFHFIFCRNVMIYFDRPTQQTLVGKLAKHLLPGAYLIIGHSESLNAIDHPLRYVRPSIYQKTV
ncbi:MAG: hypothetical protein JXO22_14055 [Phycisphaerae bacterium]|nr:hypothetical protein [Phycisphaerae bacterium]